MDEKRDLIEKWVCRRGKKVSIMFGVEIVHIFVSNVIQEDVYLRTPICVKSLGEPGNSSN